MTQIRCRYLSVPQNHRDCSIWYLFCSCFGYLYDGIRIPIFSIKIQAQSSKMPLLLWPESNLLKGLAFTVPHLTSENSPGFSFVAIASAPDKTQCPRKKRLSADCHKYRDKLRSTLTTTKIKSFTQKTIFHNNAPDLHIRSWQKIWTFAQISIQHPHQHVPQIKTNYIFIKWYIREHPFNLLDPTFGHSNKLNGCSLRQLRTYYDWGILHLSFLHCLWWPFSQRVKEYLFLYLRASLGVMVYVTRQNWAKSSSISVSFFGLWRFSHISEWRPIVGILPLPSHGDDVPTGSRAWELSLLLCWLDKPISDPNIIFCFFL